MKSLIVTALLLLCVLTLAILNLFYVDDAITGMEERLEALPSIDAPECIAQAEELESYWAEKENILGISIAYPFIDRVCEQASLLVTCASVGDTYGYYSAKALLSDALEDLSRTERFSIANLL